jgi:CheY-like chemotaxis protein
VLVVDDDADILRALTWELEAFADVKALTSVSAALPLVERGRFDVVVADLRLPDPPRRGACCSPATAIPSTRSASFWTAASSRLASASRAPRGWSRRSAPRSRA